MVGYEIQKNQFLLFSLEIQRCSNKNAHLEKQVRNKVLKGDLVLLALENFCGNCVVALLK